MGYLVVYPLGGMYIERGIQLIKFLNTHEKH